LEERYSQGALPAADCGDAVAQVFFEQAALILVLVAAHGV
jgi:hypothetical protein